MSTSTAVRGLVKPAGSENVDVSILNDNMDILDPIPLGLLASGYAASTVVQGPIAPAALTDITGLAVTITAKANRRIRVTGYIPISQITTAGQVTSTIMEGATQLGGVQRNVPAPGLDLMFSQVIISPGAGVHTYKLQLSTTAGSVSSNCSGTNPGFILVEDIGPVAGS